MHWRHAQASVNLSRWTINFNLSVWPTEKWFVPIFLLFFPIFKGLMKLVTAEQNDLNVLDGKESLWKRAEVTGWVNGQCVSTPPTSWWPRWGLQLSWHMDRWPLAADLYSGRHWGMRHTMRWTLQRMRERTLCVMWRLSYMTFKTVLTFRRIITL